MTSETQRWLVTWRLQGSPDELPLSLLLHAPEEVFARIPRGAVVSQDLNSARTWCSLGRNHNDRQWYWRVYDWATGNDWVGGEACDLAAARRKLRTELIRCGIEVPE